MEEIKQPACDIKSYSTETDFNKLQFSFEIKLALDDIVDGFKNSYYPSNKLRLFMFLKNNISGECREYFISKLFESEKDKDNFMQIILETNKELQKI